VFHTVKIEKTCPQDSWRVTIKLLFIHTIAWWQLTSETCCVYV